ncbi:MAG: TVP38/TMEM64 family protein [Rhodopirellula sp.]|nr:TVP38/TMEM64 family protein [Rhodopirellula sp.]
MPQGIPRPPESGDNQSNTDVGDRADDATENATGLPDASPSISRRYRKLLILIIVAATAGGLAWQFGNYLKLDYLATQESQLRAFQQQYPVLVFGVAFLIYVLVTGLSLPGAAPLTLLYGWYFGFGPTLILVSFASTAGATISFLTSRYLLRGSLEHKFGDRLQTFNQHLESEGAFYLFTLRLIPVVPFFVINLVMGLTQLPTRTYWWVSQLGMLPGTAVYVYAGSSVPNLGQLADQGAAAVLSPQQLFQLFLAFALLGVFPLIVKLLVTYLGRSTTGTSR